MKSKNKTTSSKKKKETDEARINSEDLNAKVNQIAANLPDTNLSLNKTRNLYDEEKIKSENATESLKNFAAKNDNIQEEIKTVNFFLEFYFDCKLSTK